MNVFVFYAVLLGSCGYATLFGGRTERIVATLFVLAAIATTAVPHTLGESYSKLYLGVFAIDVALLMALLIVAVLSERTWPMLVCAVQLLTVAVHIAKLYDRTLVPWMYQAAASKLSYLTLALLIIGTVGHRRRLSASNATPGSSSSS